MKLPELSPFTQNLLRLRLQKQARPPAMVRRSDSSFI